MCVCVRMRTCAKSLQLCLTLHEPMDCSPPGTSVHGVTKQKISSKLPSPFVESSQLKAGLYKANHNSLNTLAKTQLSTCPQHPHSQQPKTSVNPSAHQWMDEQNVVYKHNGVLHSSKREQASNRSYNMDEP